MAKPKSTTTKSTFRLYWQHARRHKKFLVGILIAAPLGVLGEYILVPLYASQVLNQLSSGGSNQTLSDFYPLLGMVLLAELLNVIMWRVLLRLHWNFEDTVMREMYDSNFDYLIHQSHRFFVNRFAGSLVSQANKFVGSFERLFDEFVYTFYVLFCTYVFSMIVLWPKAPQAVIALVIITIVYLVVITKLKRSEAPLNEAISKAEHDQTGQLADSITNAMTVKSFAGEKKEKELYAKRTTHSWQVSLDLMHTWIKHEFATGSVFRLMNVAALIIAIIAVLNFNAPVGTMFLIMSYTSTILGRLWGVQYSFRGVNRALGDAVAMTELLTDVPAEVKDDSSAPRLKAPKGGVHFDAVDFGYPEQQASSLFSKFTLDVKPGEKIGLVGPSGGGKTTVTMLLLRFMDIQGGSIKIDGQDISTVQQKSLRETIAYVPQEPMMFHRSIADNIRYVRQEATDEDIIKAAKRANAHEFIEQLPQGYKTLVGERGTKLSGGQRQRVAIARAILSDAPILVLDEATSALDSESEKLIQDALKKLMKGRTTLVIAHRLSTIQTMDRIVVLEQGHITEQGSHKELLAKKGHYANLWNHQSGGFLED